MLCSESELNLSDESDGITELLKSKYEKSIGKSYFSKSNLNLIDLSITPNRPDCLGLRGIAREKNYNNYNSIGNPGSNLSLAQMSTGTQFGLINSANHPANRPNTTAPHQMSEFYFYDHDASSASAPTVFTNSASHNTNLDLLSVAGNVSSDGGATVTQRGVVIAANTTTPTLSNNFEYDTASGTTGTFTVTFDTSQFLVGPNGTTYYCRAYATNSVGTSYGSTRSVTIQPSGGGGFQ